MDKVILHVDMDAFYASIEQRDQPKLRGRPVIVGASPDQRGVVAASSYEARRFGVYSAMPSREAGRLCPQGVFIPPDMPRYEAVSREIMTILERFTPLIEPLSLDEAFLDVTGGQRMFGSGPEIGRRIKDTILAETGLTASVGVASNKFLAKLASDLEKPDGLTVAPSGREAVLAFLAPMSVGRVWGVGEVMRVTLERAGIRTIGDLQTTSPGKLAALIGGHLAQHLLRLAWGEDARELELDTLAKSISREYTFGADCADRRRVEAVLMELLDDVGIRLREDGRHAGVLKLKLRWKDFTTFTRQVRLPRPSNDDITLREAARKLFAIQRLIRPVRLIGVGVSSLAPMERQLTLFDLPDPAMESRERLSHTVDAIRRRYGAGSIGRGAAIVPMKMENRCNQPP